MKTSTLRRRMRTALTLGRPFDLHSFAVACYGHEPRSRSGAGLVLAELTELGYLYRTTFDGEGRWEPSIPGEIFGRELDAAHAQPTPPQPAASAPQAVAERPVPAPRAWQGVDTACGAAWWCDGLACFWFDPVSGQWIAGVPPTTVSWSIAA